MVYWLCWWMKICAGYLLGGNGLATTEGLSWICTVQWILVSGVNVDEIWVRGLGRQKERNLTAVLLLFDAFMRWNLMLGVEVLVRVGLPSEQCSPRTLGSFSSWSLNRIRQPMVPQPLPGEMSWVEMSAHLVIQECWGLPKSESSGPRAATVHTLHTTVLTFTSTLRSCAGEVTGLFLMLLRYVNVFARVSLLLCVF